MQHQTPTSAPAWSPSRPRWKQRSSLTAEDCRLPPVWPWAELLPGIACSPEWSIQPQHWPPVESTPRRFSTPAIDIQGAEPLFGSLSLPDLLRGLADIEAGHTSDADAAIASLQTRRPGKAAS